MKTAYLLIGIPASGKSTWVNSYLTHTELQTSVLSTDNYIEQYASSVGKTYSEVFDECIKTATTNMNSELDNAIKNNYNIIWDQTNVSAKSRTKKLSRLDGYNKVAVFFDTPEPEELARRLNSRPGKHIPDTVIKSMIDNFEPPTLSEGFHQIINSKEFKLL